MIQEKNSNIEPDGLEVDPEYIRELWVYAMMMWLCVRQGSAADFRKEIKNCVKDAHLRMAKMFAALRAPRKS